MKRREPGITRRSFAIAAGSAFASVTLGEACTPFTDTIQAAEPRLTARARAGVRNQLKSGPLGLGSDTRDGLIQIPSVLPEGPVPLLVFLHGATQSGAGMVRRIGPAADQAGVVLLAPDSRATTWDAIRGSFDEDVAFLNRALDHVFSRLAVDPARIAIGGFSDGASYAISLGLANGDLFPRVVANSPGFVIPVPVQGKPRFFISHGTSDPILPIDRCSRVIVPQLRAKGYDVTFREFDGRHEVPPPVADEGLRWVAAR